MKQIKLGEKTVDVKTSLSEINLNDFEKIMEIFKTTYDVGIDKYINIIQILSTLSKDEIEELDLDVFEDLIAEIQDINDFSKEAEDIFINELSIMDVKFKTKSDGTSYKFTVKEMLLLKDKLAINPDAVVIDLAMIIFKPVSIDNEGYLDITESKKREYFGTEIMMNVMIPYLMSLSNYFQNKNVKESL